MIDNRWMDKRLKEVLMIDELSIIETDKVNHTMETDMVKLVVKIECFVMSFDEFDKETGSSDKLQPMQADMSCVHTLNKPHLHEIHVVPINVKSVEISDLNASLLEKVLEITALKDDLRKLKGKTLVDNVVTKHTIDPEMLKIDVEPITPKL
ncbi:hypothetical protein Tco_0708885 [Tanacetum coccineum]